MLLFCITDIRYDVAELCHLNQLTVCLLFNLLTLLQVEYAVSAVTM